MNKEWLLAFKRPGLLNKINSVGGVTEAGLFDFSGSLSSLELILKLTLLPESPGFYLCALLFACT